MSRNPIAAVLLAAGRGIRLGHFTETVPKCLLPVNGRPIIDYVLDSVRFAGIDSVYVVTNHLEEQVVAHLGAACTSSLKRTVCHQDKLEGTTSALAATRHAILRATPPSSSILISATDYLFPKEYLRDLIAFHLTHSRPLTLSLRKIARAELRNSSIVVMGQSDEVLRIIEKPGDATDPNPIAASLLYIVPLSIYQYIDVTPRSVRGEYELPETINLMLADHIRAKGLLQPALPSVDLLLATHQSGSTMS